MNRVLLEKYDVPVPRYTSYPTVPYWDKNAPSQATWLAEVQKSISKNPAISLYLHLPFCEQLCTYCACNKRITKNHLVESPYIDSLLKEWKIYIDAMPIRPLLKTIHIGGGTPTFFAPEQLKRLFNGLFQYADIAPDHEFSFEVHPNSTTKAHLEVLYDAGFRRLSIGVQDVDKEILSIINRKQTLEDVERVTNQARKIGYTSINYDLIFGLPRQTNKHIIKTMQVVKSFSPDRIAFYSYAHVPWKSKGQRAYSKADLPLGAKKRALYELGKRILEKLGYEEIGMDHFALAKDELSIAAKAGNLHRNFMGYTDRFTNLMIGLGASSISDSWTAFVQNEKNVEAYQAAIEKGELPIIKGHLLSAEDQILRQHILNLSCNFKTSWRNPALFHPQLLNAIERLRPMEAEGLVILESRKIKITNLGRPFVRNICMALDAKYWSTKANSQQLFSQAI